MASDAVFTAIRTFLEANWSATPLAWPNEHFDPPKQAAWVAVEVEGDLLNQIEIGAPGQNAWREEGALLLHVFVPVGTGSLVARQHAKALANLFRGVTTGFVVFGNASIGVGGPGDEDGLWWELPVSIGWHYDDH
jgi:hypothetical protein